MSLCGLPRSLCCDLQRKCWWDGIEVELKRPGEDFPRTIKLWARRVWTLELSLVRTPCIPGRSNAMVTDRF